MHPESSGTREAAPAPPPTAYPGTRTRTALALGLAAALAFIALTSVRLGAQGPYADELHQAAGSFTHLGSPPFFTSRITVHGYPLLNMPYSGAIKTHLFGLYLRARGEFRIVEWRAFGILLGALGTTALAVGAAPAISPLPLALLLALTVGDASLLLLTRHDWGPAALAFLLRALVLGLWLRGEVCHPRGIPIHAGAMGLAAGFAVFEKLSSAVLLLPLSIFLAAGRPERRAARWAAAAGGLAIGAAPLAGVNLATYLAQRRLISLEDVAAPVDRSMSALGGLAASYLGMGSGSTPADFVLGLPASPILATGELALAAASFGLAALVAALASRRAAQGRWALAALAGYGAVLGGLLLLPRPTWAHHWILGTPLQYLAVALALTAARAAPGRALRTLAAALGVCCAAWVGVRAAAVWRLEEARASGRASRAFDPDLSALGEFAARRADRAIFVATDWGVASAIYCLADGRPGLVHEPIWEYRGVDQLRAIQRESGKPLLYLVRPDPPVGVGGATTRRIEEDVASSPAWVELPLEPGARAWRNLSLRKYAYRGEPEPDDRAATPP